MPKATLAQFPISRWMQKKSLPSFILPGYTFFIEIRFLNSLFITGAGKVFVVTEEVTASKEIVKLHFAAKDLDKKDFFGKSDPFMVISRTSPMHSGNNL